MKFRASWWFKDSIDGLTRGVDIIESDEDLDEDDVIEIMDAISDEEGATINDNRTLQLMPKFYWTARPATRPETWGVLKVTCPLRDDYERVKRAWDAFKKSHWNPSLVLSVHITELRKLDRGIDYPLKRLMNSQEYARKIRAYGAPSHKTARSPFKWNGKHYTLIRVK